MTKTGKGTVGVVGDVSAGGDSEDFLDVTDEVETVVEGVEELTDVVGDEVFGVDGVVVDDDDDDAVVTGEMVVVVATAVVTVGVVVVVVDVGIGGTVGVAFEAGEGFVEETLADGGFFLLMKLYNLTNSCTTSSVVCGLMSFATANCFFMHSLPPSRP